MTSIRDYSALISALPVMRQAGLTKAENWNGRGSEAVNSALSGIFGNDDSVSYTRNDLMLSAKHDSTLTFALKVFVWGYPRGMRGVNFKNICAKFDLLIEHLERLKSSKSIDWGHEKAFLQKIPGLNISTYSKLLYFLGKDVEGNKCLILDNRVISALQSYQFEEGGGLSSISYQSALNRYPEYLDFTQKCSISLKVEPDQIEMFLFYFGADFRFAH